MHVHIISIVPFFTLLCGDIWGMKIDILMMLSSQCVANVMFSRYSAILIEYLDLLKSRNATKLIRELPDELDF